MNIINGRIIENSLYDLPEIYCEAEIDINDRMEWVKAMNDDKKLELYAADNNGDYYLVKDCVVTNFSYGTNSNNEIVSSIEFRGRGIEDGIIKINFKDIKSLEVPYKHYARYLENNKKEHLAEITYGEFKDIVMVEEL